MRRYTQLCLVILSIIIGGVLDFIGHDAAAHLVLGVSAIGNVIPLLFGMVEDLRSGKYGVDILAATAIIASVLLHEYWAGMVIVLMLTGGETLEDYAERRAKRELSDLLERKPKKAHLLRGNQTIDVDIKDVKVGDKLMILPGEVIPVDATVIEGVSSIDESSLTGESLPVPKQVNDQLMSGAVNLEGALTVKALHSAADSQYEQIIKLVRTASASQSPFVRLADRYSIPFTIFAFVIAGAAWFVSADALRFLEVIVVATPCPLLLAAPIALISGMSRSAKNGIIVKTGSALERLAEVKTMAFDKTGTLTRGVPVVESIVVYNKHSKDSVLEAAAALEQNSNHVLAQAIVTKAAKQKLNVRPAKQVKETAGRGLSGRVHSKTVCIGRLVFLQEQDISLPKKMIDAKQTSTYVAIDNELAGVITFTDELRSDAKSTIQALKQQGVTDNLIVTGDNHQTAQVIAKTLGIEKVVADCLPGDKIRAIEAVSERPVAFVGDGVNDAPVLTASDVGIALGARGSTAASESADVVILHDDIGKVVVSVAIAKRTFSIARQSILIGIFISMGLMVIFASGRFKPVYGAALQEVVDITVIFNALRAHTAGGGRRAEA